MLIPAACDVAVQRGWQVADATDDVLVALEPVESLCQCQQSQCVNVKGSSSGGSDGGRDKSKMASSDPAACSPGSTTRSSHFF